MKRLALILAVLALSLIVPAGAAARAHHAHHKPAQHALRHHRAHKANDVEVDFMLEGPTPFTPEAEAEALALLAEAEAEEGPDPCAVTQCVVMED